MRVLTDCHLFPNVSQESHHSGASRSLSGAGLSELPLSDLVTAQLMDAVQGSRVGGRLAVGLGRWIYHLPTLKSTQPWACMTC